MEQYVYQVFGEIKTESGRRRLRLVLDLSKQPRPVPRAQLRALSTELVELYSGKTDKTLTRDANELRRVDLVRRVRDGYVPQNQKIIAFMTPEINEDGVLDVRLCLIPPQGMPHPQIRVPIEATPEQMPPEA